jgi:hypothetical protein
MNPTPRDNPEAFSEGFVVVSAVHNVDGSGFGVPSAVTYDLHVYIGGDQFDVENVKPNQIRPPDTVDLMAAKVGNRGTCSIVADTFYFNVAEFPRMDRVCS